MKLSEMALAVVVVALFLGIVLWAVHLSDEKDANTARYNKWVGACEYQGGHADQDYCIKGNTVLNTYGKKP